MYAVTGVLYQLLCQSNTTFSFGLNVPVLHASPLFFIFLGVSSTSIQKTCKYFQILPFVRRKRLVYRLHLMA